MDIDGDGHTDVLSGCYSHEDSHELDTMIGYFQVLRGQDRGGFGKPQVLLGADGEPLVMRLEESDAEEPLEVDRFCTSTTAGDLDGDGRVEIVSGNAKGTFGLFFGTDEGSFDPVAKLLRDTQGKPLFVEDKSAPSLVDWDGDGDLDLLSGSGLGGVFLFRNVGTRDAFRFGVRETLIERSPYSDAIEFGASHFKGAATATHVAAADVTGDGRLDLLVGDACHYLIAVPGLSEGDVRTRLALWQTEVSAHYEAMPEFDGEFESMDEADQRRFDAWTAELERLEAKKATFVDDRSTGFVWLYAQE